MTAALTTFLRHRRVRPGACLSHAKVLLGAIGVDGYDAISLCMGFAGRRRRILHCWIEDEVGDVIDLTRPSKVFPRKAFYHLIACVEAASVRRYDFVHVLERVAAGALDFWDFPDAHSFTSDPDASSVQFTGDASELIECNVVAITRAMEATVKLTERFPGIAITWRQLIVRDL